MRTPINEGLLQSDLDCNGFDLLNADVAATNGVPAGGTTGQSLTKTSDTDYDVDWSTVTGGGGGGFSFDVTQYGATGDGATDDTAAIQDALAAIPATGGLLYFPAGRYKYTGATLALNKPVTVMGDGGAIGGVSILLTTADLTRAISVIEFNSANLPLFTINADSCGFQSIELLNTYSGTPSSGSCAVLVSTKGDFTWARDSTFSGFYINVDIRQGAYNRFEGCLFVDPVHYGMKIQNLLNMDIGGHFISSCNFMAGPNNPAAAFRCESGGGTKIVNTNFNAGMDGLYVDMIQLALGAGILTSDFLVSNCSFENYTGTAIKGTTGAGAIFANTVIHGNQIALGSGTSGGIDFNGDFRGIVITGNWGLVGFSSAPFISLTNVGNIAVSGNSASGYASVISIGAGCSFAEAPVYIGMDARLVSITGGAKLQVRNPGTGLWADGDQWTNP